MSSSRTKGDIINERICQITVFLGVAAGGCPTYSRRRRALEMLLVATCQDRLTLMPTPGLRTSRCRCSATVPDSRVSAVRPYASRPHRRNQVLPPAGASGYRRDLHTATFDSPSGVPQGARPVSFRLQPLRHPLLVSPQARIVSATLRVAVGTAVRGVWRGGARHGVRLVAPGCSCGHQCTRRFGGLGRHSEAVARGAG
jgi:hypothetical protein